MLFSSMCFLWVFLPIVIIMYQIIDNKYRNILLLCASLVFYAWGEFKYILLMLVSILVNYIFGILIEEVRTIKRAKIYLTICLIINLGILGYFKYFSFIVDNINIVLNKQISVKNIALPVGISFYTFQALSYVVDVYRSKKDNNDEIKAQRNLINLALYVALFPQLIAGPIVKYYDIEKQLTNRTVDGQMMAYGIKRFTYGLGKKVLISNILASVADKIFATDLQSIGTASAWLGILCYSLQIYYDFSGYSDMAIGLGKMFGFDFSENFNYPYISKSIKEFWRRWHISLSTWFREYLYIPLGGNRKGKIRTYINLFIVFLATGVWHGASWTFIIWGIFHGSFLILERIFLGGVLEKNKFKILNHIYTMLVVTIGWVFFRADNMGYAVEYLRKMFTYSSDNTVYGIGCFINREVIGTLILGIALCGTIQTFIPKVKEVIYDREKTYIYELIVIPFILCACIVYLVSGVYNPFIYFRF